jgi:metal-responsive CopG/Arc/MetJ family transcriptional regulator
MARGGKREGAGRPKGNPDELYRRVTLTLSPKVLERVDEYAAASGLTRSAAVEKLMTLGLKKL